MREGEQAIRFYILFLLGFMSGFTWRFQSSFCETTPRIRNRLLQALSLVPCSSSWGLRPVRRFDGAGGSSKVAWRVAVAPGENDGVGNR